MKKLTIELAITRLERIKRDCDFYIDGNEDDLDRNEWLQDKEACTCGIKALQLPDRLLEMLSAKCNSTSSEYEWKICKMLIDDIRSQLK